MDPEVRVQNPYVGPRPFEEQDQDRFFGRERESKDLLSLVFAHRTLLLYAPSGAGKTSILNAGLLPLLRKEGFEILPPARVQGLFPDGIELEAVPNPYAFHTLLSWAGTKFDPEQLPQMSLASFLKQREHPTDEQGFPKPRLAIFDQFEELFTAYPGRWKDRRALVEQIGEAVEADPSLRVLLLLREDFTGQLDRYAPLLPRKLRTRFHLERLGRRAALRAVTEPLQDSGRSFEEGAANQLVEELLQTRVETAPGKTMPVAGQFVEPVQLQVVCQSLWRNLPPDVSLITEQHLQAFGDVDEALSEFYQDSIVSTVHRTGVAEDRLRFWFDRKLITPGGTRGTVYRGPQTTGGLSNEAVDELERLHLIRTERRAGANWYELTHDRLIAPITRANESWRAARRLRRQRVVSRVIAAAAFVVMAVLAWQTLGSTRDLSASEAEYAAVKATATVQAMADERQDQAALQSDLGNYEQAIAEYQAAIELQPGDATNYVHMGRALVKLGAYQQAIKDFDLAIELDPEYAASYNREYAAAYTGRGDAFWEQGDYEQAVADYAQAIELRPEDATSYVHMGLAHGKLGDYHQAIEDLNTAIELDPGNAMAYYNRGNAYQSITRWDLYLDDYKRAVELNIDDPIPYSALGNDCLNRGAYQEAIAYYTRAIQYGADAATLRMRALAHRSSGDYESAIADYSAAIDLSPADAEAYYDRAVVYRLAGDSARAIADCDEAIALDPEYAAPHYEQGYAHYIQGDRDLARTDYEKAVELDATYANRPYSLVSNVVLRPPSPAHLSCGAPVEVTFAYSREASGGVQIWAHPFANGAPALNYVASGSPTYTASEGDGVGTFSIQTGNVAVDEIRIQMRNADHTQLLCELSVPVTYTFAENGAHLGAPTHISPADLTVFDHYPRTTHLQWLEVPGAAHYSVEIDCYHCCQADKWCTEAGQTYRIVPNLTRTSYAFDFVGTQPGRWRVWAVGADGREGPKSDWWEFRYTR